MSFVILMGELGGLGVAKKRKKKDLIKLHCLCSHFSLNTQKNVSFFGNIPANDRTPVVKKKKKVNRKTTQKNNHTTYNYNNNIPQSKHQF